MKRQKPESQHVETPLVGVKRVALTGRFVPRANKPAPAAGGHKGPNPPSPPPPPLREVASPLSKKPARESRRVGVQPSPQAPEGERLARFLAHAGVASRRRAEELIADGRVQVNGATITTQGSRIDPAHDLVCVDGKPINAVTKHVYILLHKPAGYVSTARDPQGRPTVLDLLPPEVRRLRVYPVGRLDIDTSGLLLLTNDGDFALHLTHPRYSMEKEYHVLIEGCPSETALNALRHGVTFSEDDGRSHTSTPAQVRLLRQVGTDCWLSLTIHEGRKRQVRRMLAAVGYRIRQLVRVGIGPLSLGDVPAGTWRYLSDAEVRSLL